MSASKNECGIARYHALRLGVEIITPPYLFTVNLCPEFTIAFIDTPLSFSLEFETAGLICRFVKTLEKRSDGTLLNFLQGPFARNSNSTDLDYAPYQWIEDPSASRNSC